MSTVTKSAHTPGPWTLYEEGRDDNIKVEANGKGSICKVARKGPDSRDRDLERANARLIAAAPELLEALELVYDNAPLTATPEDIRRRIMDKVESAIQKANGL